MGFEAIPKIPAGLNIYLSLVPSGEESWLEINCNGEWLALFYWSQDGQDNYFSYNSAFADTLDRIIEEDFSDKDMLSPLVSGGQSPVPRVQTITDIESGVKAAEYFIRTGEFYPGIVWMQEFVF
jgi:hypothetical protein